MGLVLHAIGPTMGDASSEEAATALTEGRLDRPEQITGLRWERVLAARTDPDLDLRTLTARNRRFVDKLHRVVRAFPSVIDSRGRILRPPGEERPGAGIVRRLSEPG